MFFKKKLLTTGFLIGLSGASIAATVQLNLLTDDFGSETSFSLTPDPAGANIAFDSHNPMDPDLADGFASAGDLNSATAYTFNWDNLSTGDYLFTINDSFGDGICCGFGIGNYSLDLNGSQVFASSGDFGSSESFSFSVNNVPEPSAIALFSVALAGLAFSNRRAKKA